MPRDEATPGTQALDIEWKHIEGAWSDCDRCSSTGETLTGLLPDLARRLGPLGFSLHYKETVLPLEGLASSNQVLFNGRPVEELLGMTLGQSPCDCASGCNGGPAPGQGTCRTLVRDGVVHEALAKDLLWEAVQVAVGCRIDPTGPTRTAIRVAGGTGDCGCGDSR